MNTGAKRLTPSSPSEREEGDGKRVRPSTPDAPQPIPTPTSAADQVVMALTKLTRHLADASKFKKCSALLQTLLTSDSLTSLPHPAPAPLPDVLFTCLLTALRHLELFRTAPALRKDLLRLATAATSNSLSPLLPSPTHASLLKELQRTHASRLPIYTDDSFAFAATVKDIEKQLTALQEVEEGDADKDAYDVLAGMIRQERPRGGRGGSGAEGGGGGTAAVGVGGDSSKQGEDKLALCNDAVAPSEVDPSEVDLTDRVVLAMRREGVLLCYEAMRDLHGKPWARATVEMGVSTLAQHAGTRLCPQQQGRVRDLVTFCQRERAKRSQAAGGGSGKVEKASAIDLADKAWAKKEGVSKRGSVTGGAAKGGGGGGYNWLG